MTPPPSHNSSDLSTRATPHTALFISILQSIDRHFPSAQVEIDMALGENWLVRGPLVGILREAMGRFGEEDLSTAVPWRDSLSPSIIDAIKSAYHNASDASRVKALLIANPHNPTGRSYPASVIRELMKFCKEKGLHYISDELFAMSDFGEEKEFVSALALVGDGEGEESPMDASKVHVIYSMSKDFGAAGIRSGFVISPRNRPVLDGSIIANFMQTSILNDHFLTALCNSPTLPTIITTLKTHLAKNDALVTEAFDSWAIDYLPTTAGFHVFAKLGKDAQTWEEEEDIVKRFLDCGVMVGPGKGFGGIDGQVGWIRISFSIEEKKVKEGLRRIGKTLGLKKESGAV